MKVSVIVPVYNTEKYLEKCICSVLNQTYKNIELVLINDGSTDNSDNICRAWFQKDCRIKYICQENQGQGVARNKGIEKAEGQYLIFVDSDDWIELNLIEVVLKYMEQNKADICVFSYRMVQDKNIIEIPLEFQLCEGKSISEEKEVLSHLMPVLCNKMFRTDLLKKSNIQMKNFICEDLLYQAQLYIYANKIVTLDKCFYNYRYSREGNMSTNFQGYFEVTTSVELLNQFYKKRKLWDRYWKELYLLSFHIFKDILFRIHKRQDLHIPFEIKERYPKILQKFKICLSKYYSHKINMGLLDKKYLLIGSYNLRVIIHTLLLEEENLKQDFPASSLISMMSDNLWMESELLFKNTSFKNSYRKRAVEQDIFKVFLRERISSEIDFVVIDCLEEIYDIYEIAKDTYITDSDYLQEVKKELFYMKIPFLCEKRRKLYEKAVKRLAIKLKETNIKIVIIKNFLSERHSKYYDMDILFENIKQIKAINEELEWCYEMLISNFPSAYVVDTLELEKLRFTFENFPFGCIPFYYNNGYYRQVAIQLNETIGNHYE